MICTGASGSHRWRDKSLGQGHERSRVAVRRGVRLTDAATEFIIKEGTSELYGARELNRAVDRFIGFPIGIADFRRADCLAKDRIKVDLKDGDTDLTLVKLERL